MKPKLDTGPEWTFETLPELTDEMLAEFAAPDPASVSPAVTGFALDIEAFLGTLKIRELRMLEFVLKVNAGKILTAFSGPNAAERLDGNTLTAVIWVALRREDEKATLRDALEVDLLAIEGDDETAGGDPDTSTGATVAGDSQPGRHGSSEVNDDDAGKGHAAAAAS